MVSTLTEIKRVLRPGGLFINTLYTNETLDRFPHTQTGYKRFTQEQLVDGARKAGFEVEVASIMEGAAYCVVCHKI